LREGRAVSDRQDYADRDLPPAPGWMNDAVHVLYFFASVWALAGFLLLIAWWANRGPN